VRLAIVLALAASTAFAEPPRYTRAQRIPPPQAKPVVVAPKHQPTITADDLRIGEPRWFDPLPVPREDYGPDHLLRAARTYSLLFRLWHLEAESIR
jgi:hypothetical protein